MAGGIILMAGYARGAIAAVAFFMTVAFVPDKTVVFLVRGIVLLASG